jgi:ATP-dependent RNA helicase RhlE
MSFNQLGLSDALVQGILATGYSAPTEIQARAIPLALEGNDVMGLAQTGTGKTAAFVLPMLNRLANAEPSSSKTRHVRALVLTPTRELAQQIETSIKEYGRFLKFFSLTIYGGTDMRRQLQALRRGHDILIATPGRLLDHLGQRTIDLSHVELLVLDEADRMLDMGFFNDVKKIISFVPEERQTLLFSATMSKEIKDLASSVQKSPKLVEVGERRSPADSVTQYFYKAEQDQKSELLFHILETVDMDSVLVFSRTKHGADKIAHRLERRGVTATAIHSNRTQSQRERALAGFKKKHFKVLVATDVAARGIDIDGISHVINYDTPNFAEDYVHRIGRTGRATSTGDAITFVSRDEYDYFKRICQYVGKRYEVKPYPEFDYAQATVKAAERRAEHQRMENESQSEVKDGQSAEYVQSGELEEPEDSQLVVLRKHSGGSGGKPQNRNNRDRNRNGQNRNGQNRNNRDRNRNGQSRNEFGGKRRFNQNSSSGNGGQNQQSGGGQGSGKKRFDKKRNFSQTGSQGGNQNGGQSQQGGSSSGKPRRFNKQGQQGGGQTVIQMGGKRYEKNRQGGGKGQRKEKQDFDKVQPQINVESGENRFKKRTANNYANSFFKKPEDGQEQKGDWRKLMNDIQSAGESIRDKFFKKK